MPSQKEIIAAQAAELVVLRGQLAEAAAAAAAAATVVVPAAAAAAATPANNVAVLTGGPASGPVGPATPDGLTAVIAAMEARLAASEARNLLAAREAPAAGPTPHAVAPSLVADLDAARVAFCAPGPVSQTAYVALQALGGRMAAQYGAGAASELATLLGAAASPGTAATAVLPALDALRAKMAQHIVASPTPTFGPPWGGGAAAPLGGLAPPLGGPPGPAGGAGGAWPPSWAQSAAPWPGGAAHSVVPPVWPGVAPPAWPGAAPLAWPGATPPWPGTAPPQTYADALKAPTAFGATTFFDELQAMVQGANPAAPHSATIALLSQAVHERAARLGLPLAQAATPELAQARDALASEGQVALLAAIVTLYARGDTLLLAGALQPLVRARLHTLGVAATHRLAARCVAGGLDVALALALLPSQQMASSTPDGAVEAVLTEMRAPRGGGGGGKGAPPPDKKAKP